jgi:hypothetical protein
MVLKRGPMRKTFHGWKPDPRFLLPLGVEEFVREEPVRPFLEAKFPAQIIG